ncbi:MAG: EAL domain-containing protein, partial [Clostridiales bacterium]|nr:EAL domain-containing protein [Clostridiales bacterium]
MKACSKRNIFGVLIPILLITSIVLCAWLYRKNALAHNEVQRNSLLYQYGIEQGHLFREKVSGKFSALNFYSGQISGVKWQEYPLVLPKINIAAAGQGFSYVTVVGPDGIFYDKDNKAVNISDKEFYKCALKGQSRFEKSNLNGQNCFAYAVPFLVNGNSEGAVVGLVTEQEMLNMFRYGDSASAAFDAEGNIILKNGEIPLLGNGINLFQEIERLAAEESIDKSVAEKLHMLTAGANPDMDCFAVKSRDGYFVFCQAGIENLYIVRYVSQQEFSGESGLNRTKLKIPYILIFVFSALLLISVVIIAKERMDQIDKERRKGIKAVYTDPLTGLYNKTGFEKKTHKRLLSIPADRVCALISFEVVSFRSYNALYGFAAGDRLLKTISDIVRQYTGKEDVVGRLYADHFVWLAEGDSREEIFDKLKDAVRNAKDCGLPFFLCGGIYMIEDRGMDVQKMIDNASIAKDTIKHKFSTGIAIYDDSMLECQLEDAELVGNMMRGLENGEFVDYYQPKYNMDDECLSGAEALVRWKKPDGEIIMPGRFIELFEKNGFIRKLDFYMYEKACEMIKDLQDKDLPILPISVNFSRVHLYDSRFPERIFKIAQKYGVDTKYIEIELTESAFLLEGEILEQIVDKLHEYGFSVSIDDFGSGFSSLNMLKDVEVDTLKIDMKFLEGFERGGRVGTVVTSVIRMAKWLGIPVVAEGVETKEQVDFLRTLGCEMVQGFYYSRALPRETYLDMIANRETVHCGKDKPAAITLDSINAVLGGNSLVTSLVEGILGGFGIYEFSEGRLEAIRVNRAYCEILGYPDMASFSAHSLNVLTQVYPSDLDEFVETCKKAVSTGAVQKFTARRYDYYGNIIQFKGFLKHIGGTDTRPLICISFLDATDLMQSQREKELNKYSNALYGIFDEIYEMDYADNSLRILSSNRKRYHEKVFNLIEFEKNWLYNKLFPDDRETIENLISKARTDKLELPVTVEYRVIDNGEVKWKMSSMVSVSGGSYLICTLDITQKKQFEMFAEKMESLNQRIEFDMMTGVLNKSAAELFISAQLRKKKADRNSALLIISIDDFQYICDKYGKPAAANLIKDAALRIKNLFREQDIIGRI